MANHRKVVRHEQKTMPPSMVAFLSNPVQFVRKVSPADISESPIEAAREKVLADALIYGFFYEGSTPTKNGAKPCVCPFPSNVSTYRKIEQTCRDLYRQEATMITKVLERSQSMGPDAAIELASTAIDSHALSVKGLNKSLTEESPTREHTAFCKKVIKLRDRFLTAER